MNNVECTIWGRKLNLPVKYDILDNEIVLAEQKKALEIFLSSADLSDNTKIKEYCVETSPEKITGGIDNIFRFVKPTALYVVRSTKDHLVAILCNYLFDEEHGIAVVYENEKVKEIGSQDIIL